MSTTQTVVKQPVQASRTFDYLYGKKTTPSIVRVLAPRTERVINYSYSMFYITSICTMLQIYFLRHFCFAQPYTRCHLMKALFVVLAKALTRSSVLKPHIRWMASETLPKKIYSPYRNERMET